MGSEVQFFSAAPYFSIIILDKRFGIDDPVGKYLPDFPLKGPQAVTLRHCFTHTSGLDGHGLFDGVHNPWLENTLFQTIKNDTVGTRYAYNGMGFDLAGKVMEVVSGKSIFRLFHEYLYSPLGMQNTYHTWDLGYSVHSTAYDLSILAQMVLNQGTYDGSSTTTNNFPGFKRYTIRPLFDKNFDNIDGSFNSNYGKIAISWSRKKGNLMLSLNIPANTKADVILDKAVAGNWVLNDKKLNAKLIRDQVSEESTNLVLGSGKYHFRFIKE